jgi:hypothetical protein
VKETKYIMYQFFVRWTGKKIYFWFIRRSVSFDLHTTKLHISFAGIQIQLLREEGLYDISCVKHVDFLQGRGGRKEAKDIEQ